MGKAPIIKKNFHRSHLLKENKAKRNQHKAAREYEEEKVGSKFQAIFIKNRINNFMDISVHKCDELAQKEKRVRCGELKCHQYINT